MISFDADGVTVFYLDATGQRIARNFMAGEPYNDMLVIMDAQHEATRENLQAASNYTTALANIQISVNNGHTNLTPPAKPLMKLVADADGKVSYVQFVPPLGDLVMPAATTGGGPTLVDAITAARAANPDKQAIMYNMILAMFKKEFPGA